MRDPTWTEPVIVPAIAGFDVLVPVIEEGGRVVGLDPVPVVAWICQISRSRDFARPGGLASLASAWPICVQTLGDDDLYIRLPDGRVMQPEIDVWEDEGSFFAQLATAGEQ